MWGKRNRLNKGLDVAMSSEKQKNETKSYRKKGGKDPNERWIKGVEVAMSSEK